MFKYFNTAKLVFFPIVFILFFIFLIKLKHYINNSNYINFPQDNISDNDRNTDNTTLLLGGDVMLGRSVYQQIKSLSDSSYPFRKISEVLQGADFTIINLENPIIENCPQTDIGFKFCTGEEAIDGLIFAGIDVVNLANNHSKNYGQSGYEQTLKNLEEAGILFIGNNNLIIRQLYNSTIGFLGFDYTVKRPTNGDYKLAKDSDLKVDILIVALHWGIEYTEIPADYQKSWAKEFVKNGADVVMGHHPHWVQDIQYLNKHTLDICDTFSINDVETPVITGFKETPESDMRVRVISSDNEKFRNIPNDCVPIYYSLGNLVFDQMWSEETKKGILVKLTLENKRIVGEEIIPTYMIKLGQPEIVGN